MKKLAFTLLILLAFILNINAENIKVYIQKSGGEKNALFLGRTGYDYYHYSNYTDSISIVCKNSGLHKCKIMKLGVEDRSEVKLIRIINKAIRKSERKVRRGKTKAGVINYKIRNYNISVEYKNTDKYGNGEFKFELIEKI
jgi:hypothetical protein